MIAEAFIWKNWQTVIYLRLRFLQDSHGGQLEVKVVQISEVLQLQTAAPIILKEVNNT